MEVGAVRSIRTVSILKERTGLDRMYLIIRIQLLILFTPSPDIANF
jgi:hypothetical protein